MHFVKQELFRVIGVPVFGAGATGTRGEVIAMGTGSTGYVTWIGIAGGMGFSKIGAPIFLGAGANPFMDGGPITVDVTACGNGSGTPADTVLPIVMQSPAVDPQHPPPVPNCVLMTVELRG